MAWQNSSAGGKTCSEKMVGRVKPLARSGCTKKDQNHRAADRHKADLGRGSAACEPKNAEAAANKAIQGASIEAGVLKAHAA